MPEAEQTAEAAGAPAGRMIAVRLPDGSSFSVAAGSTVEHAARAINPRLAREALAGRVNGRLVDLTHELCEDCSLEIVTPEDTDAIEVLRHSTSHCLAQAVKELFPETKIAQGPAIEDGFYYDFDRDTPFTEEDLARIEERMREIVRRDLPIRRLEMPKEEAVGFFEAEEEPYKTYFAASPISASDLIFPLPAASAPSSCSP